MEHVTALDIDGIDECVLVEGPDMQRVYPNQRTNPMIESISRRRSFCCRCFLRPLHYLQLSSLRFRIKKTTTPGLHEFYADPAH